MSEIGQFGLTFSEALRISFEDALFIGEYLLNASAGKIAFLADAKYFARRRAVPNSVTGNSLQKPEFWLSCLKGGALRLLELYAKEKGFVPQNIQKTVLYDLVWRIRYMVDTHSSIECLTEDQQESVLDVLGDIFGYIDADVIESSPGSIYWYMYKVGLLKRFKNSSPVNVYMYLWNIDFVNRVVVFRAFGELPKVYLSGKETRISVRKTILHHMLDYPFVQESLVSVSFSNVDDSLEAYYCDKKARIMLHGKNLSGLSIEEIIEIWTSKWKGYKQRGDLWLVSDSIGAADDNGEHFYRYLRKSHPKQKAYYVLDKGSPDWSRLEKEGFKLLPYGTKRFEKKLKRASTIISSQLMKGMMDYWGDSYGLSKRRIFLQHGVVKDDLSEYFNAWSVDAIVTSTKSEWNSIVSNGSSYRYEKSQVLLTGLPRFDRLRQLSFEHRSKRVILFAPTWRKGIVSGCTDLGGARELLDGFFASDYYCCWRNLLCSDALNQVLSQGDYVAVFKPHPNMAEMLERVDWDAPERVRIAGPGESYQSLISCSALVVTDYSSLPFDAAYIGSPSIYYQFDKNDFFSSHTYKPGYFDYEKDGFGPVVFTEEGVLDSLSDFVGHNGEIGEPYRSRINGAFANRDGGCCSRVYDALSSMGNQYKTWAKGAY